MGLLMLPNNIMSSSLPNLRFLRPYLHADLPAVRSAAYARFSSSKTKPPGEEVLLSPHKPDRMRELKAACALDWPRVRSDPSALTVREFANRYKEMRTAEKREGEFVTLRGRVSGFRVASKSLVFVDVVQDGKQVQIMLDGGRMAGLGASNEKLFKKFYHLLRRGDIISVFGNPYVTKKGELSVNAWDIPEILSPSLASLPRTLDDRETRVRNRHVDMLVNNPVVETLRLRSHIIQSIRSFLLADSFLEVQTPLIADKAGGAIAKPFTTVATEFSDKTLALRIAPEIWLKRLVIGGMDRVFEIGPAFRNEGLDATHNPEFTTCEFYKAFADLEQLMSMTEAMLSGIATQVSSLISTTLTSLPVMDTAAFHQPFARIPFIPAIEAGLGEKLPDLSSPSAEKDTIALFKAHDIPLPLSPTLPRLLDKLSSIYIEPRCTLPTFITHHPSCMAPLSKSFRCSQTSQAVSARAELFIQNREVANMYEEENSPLAQREKFVQQLQWRDDENCASVDESYLEALEWALPPTGGWGAGVDRLVMLFAGRERISDVLAFGSLRNVVNLGSGWREKEVERP
ncbi:uncharacterized protein L3040_007724 [Drepanopeziza brunnea f. sp. 'multigermtubi']|uniref:uncharacterized protein n=1 Tax=Drepanopeziza brunnea f. sp. 'multigermtubi' TaxID=698441 RepID=UPI0023A5A01F|nr:hypothetical protein L3040_007724 [Drepanopeziza brunnea f. sp. 'multigermtubi']